MNTENTLAPQVSPDSNIQAIDFSSESKQLHRKIARLPKPLRDLINSSIDDGLTAKEIIQKLEASTNPPLPYPINQANISDWKTTGYMHYLAHQDRLDSIAASREAALEMVANNNNLSLPQATLQVIAAQCFEVLADFSPAAIKQKLAEEPLKYTSFLHVFARLTREMVHLEKFQEARAAAQAEKSDPNSDKEAEAAEFWTRHTKALFNQKDPTRIKLPSSSSLIRSAAKIENPSRPSCATPSTNPESSIEHPASVPIENQNGKTSLVSKIKNPAVSATTTQILEEHCLDCRHPLPPLTPDGKRPRERCEQCNILLPPPGTCTRPSRDQCHHCGATLPHRLPSGRRPKYVCHNCGAGLGRELDEDIQKYAEE